MIVILSSFFSLIFEIIIHGKLEVISIGPLGTLNFHLSLGGLAVYTFGENRGQNLLKFVCLFQVQVFYWK